MANKLLQNWEYVHKLSNNGKLIWNISVMHGNNSCSRTTLHKWIEDMDYLAVDSYRQTLVEVARLYYEQNLTQTEIGRKLSLSRSTVSRMLQRARDTGIVTIRSTTMSCAIMLWKIH